MQIDLDLSPFPSPATPPAPMPLRIISHNIRYATPHPSRGEEAWPTRCPRLCTQFHFLTAPSPSNSFLCLQEVLHPQLRDIHAHLGTQWDSIGVGRADGNAAGEYSPVFYRRDAWACLRSQTYWLSPTPTVPSKGWDAVLERIVTMGSFRHRATGARAVVMSTHFDHVGTVARRKSAELIMELAEKWVGEEGGDGEEAPPPAFLGGDFNSTPDDGAYKTIAGEGSGWGDVREAVAPEKRHGNRYTFTGFEPEKDPGDVKRIDFVFAREQVGVRAVSYGVVANRFDDGVFLSDHCAVVADMEIPVVT